MILDDLFRSKVAQSVYMSEATSQKNLQVTEEILGRIGAMLLYIIIWSVDDPYFFFAFGMETQNESKMRKGLT